MIETKPAISSKTIWGGLFAMIPALLLVVPDLVHVVQELATAGMLGPQGVAIGIAATGLGTIIGRYTSDEKPIKGIVNNKGPISS